MLESPFHRTRIIARYHKISTIIFIGVAVVIFVFAQYLMMREIGSPKAINWWLPDLMDMFALLFMAVPYIWGIYYRIKIGEVSIESQLPERLLKFEDQRLRGDWVIWREGAMVSGDIMSPVFLIFGLFILLMVIVTWFKILSFHGGFPMSQKAMSLQEFLFGCVLLVAGVLTWFNRQFTYRLFVRQGKTILILGMRVPMK